MRRLSAAAALAGLLSGAACHEVTQPAALVVSPAALSFSARAGGSDPPPRYLTVSRSDGASARWTWSLTANWIAVSSAIHPWVDDTLPALVLVWARTAGLPPGTLTGSIEITMGAEVRTVPVTLDLGTTRSLAGRWVGAAPEANVALTLTDDGEGTIGGSGGVSPAPGAVIVGGSYADPELSLTLVTAARDSIALVGSLTDDHVMEGTLSGGPFTSVAITLYRQ
ncbi:MAG: hypothetical protein ACREMN_02585 [Gemmatimonadales bacterium]